MLIDNLHEVQNNIKKACEKTGRKPEEVTLITVSKTKPISMIEEIYEDGIRKFGENKVQDLVDKYEAMPKDIEWHMIGYHVILKEENSSGQRTIDNFCRENSNVWADQDEIRNKYSIPSAFSAFVDQVKKE